MSKSSSSSRSSIRHYFKDNHGYDYYKREDCYGRNGARRRNHCCDDEISYSAINTGSYSGSESHSHSQHHDHHDHHHHRHHKHHKS